MGRSRRSRPVHLGAKLRRIRESLQLGQTGMAKALEARKVKEPIYPASISQYETGKREPSYPVLLVYAELAGCSTDYLIDDRLELPRRRCKKMAR